jgi:hypothetical protein
LLELSRHVVLTLPLTHTLNIAIVKTALYPIVSTLLPTPIPNPEDAQGNPVALDFSKGSKTKGYSKPYSKNYDNIFGDKKEKNKENGEMAKKL